MARAPARRARKRADGPPIVAEFRRFLVASAARVAPADVTSLLASAGRIRRRLAEEPPPAPHFSNRVEVALALLDDHVAGRAPQVPLVTVGVVAAALFYYLEPVDVIPDRIRGGTADDALVLDLAWRLGREGIERWIAARA
jgi:uncharacterized membrane protein YkvA (DUF1232 family)